MSTKLKKIEAETGYCYVPQDPEIYDSIRCPYDGQLIDTIFVHAAMSRDKKMMVEFYESQKFDINAEDADGLTVLDYVLIQTSDAKGRLATTKGLGGSQIKILEKNIKAWEAYSEWLKTSFNARRGSNTSIKR